MQVVNEFAKMNGVLEEYSELACDWQVLIDGQGTFYHMDLDRMTESRCDHKSWYHKRYKRLVPRFLEMAHQVALDLENQH